MTSPLGRGLNSLIPKKQIQGKGETLNKKESVFNVETNKIRPNPDQPRRKFDQKALKELSNSVKDYGVLQPILVHKVEEDCDRGRKVEYEIIAGERRWRAAKLASLPQVPVIVRDDAEKQRLEVSLIENVQREDLNAIEKAKAYKQLMDEFNLSMAEVSKRVGKSKPSVNNTLRLLNLSDKIQNCVTNGQISETHARALLTAEPERRMDLLNRVIKEKLPVRHLEDLARGDRVFTSRSRDSIEKDEVILAMEKDLTSALGSKVSVRQTENSGKLMINFYTRKELEQIADRLKKAGR